MTVKKAIEALLETYGSAMQRQRGAESTDFWGFLQPVSITGLSETRRQAGILGEESVERFRFVSPPEPEIQAGDFLLFQGRKFRVCRCQGYFEKDTLVCRQGVCMEVGA